MSFTLVPNGNDILHSKFKKKERELNQDFPLFLLLTRVPKADFKIDCFFNEF